jgi:hypothetical protein
MEAPAGPVRAPALHHLHRGPGRTELRDGEPGERGAVARARARILRGGARPEALGAVPAQREWWWWWWWWWWQRSRRRHFYERPDPRRIRQGREQPTVDGAPVPNRRSQAPRMHAYVASPLENWRGSVLNVVLCQEWSLTHSFSIVVSTHPSESRRLHLLPGSVLARDNKPGPVHGLRVDVHQ